MKLMAEKQIGCSCGKQAELEKLQIDYESLQKKVEQGSELHQKLRKDNAALDKLVNIYRGELRELYLSELSAGKKGAKRRQPKKRCHCCFLTFERNEAMEACNDCQKVFHRECVGDHECDLMRLDEGYSNMSIS